MELKAFVKQTILDVFEAVQEAGNEIANNPERKGAIVPVWGGIEHTSSHEHMLKFDVAVTASDIQRGQAGGGIKVLGIGVNAQGEKQKKGEEVSRVTFSIPVALPGTIINASAHNPVSPTAD